MNEKHSLISVVKADSQPFDPHALLGSFPERGRATRAEPTGRHNRKQQMEQQKI